MPDLPDVREIPSTPPTLPPPPLLDELPIPEVRMLPELRILPAPLASRYSGFEAIDTQMITALPRLLLENLSVAKDVKQETAGVLMRNGNDASRAVSNLVMLLNNVDMIDFILRIKPDVNLQKMIPIAEDWRRYWISNYANPKQLPPEAIPYYSHFLEYARTVLPIRLGNEDSLYQLYALAMAAPQSSQDIYDLQKDSFTVMDNRSIQALTNTADIALNLAGNDAKLQEQAVTGIINAIQTQDKWWMLGGGDLDPLTNKLLGLLVKRKVPGTASIVLDVLYRKAAQDEAIVKAAFIAPQDASVVHKLSKQLGIQRLIDLAIQADPEEAKRYLANRFAERGAPKMITEEIISRRELHTQEVKLGRVREIEYFGRKFRLTDLPDNEDVTLTELSFGIHAAQNAAKDKLWFFQTDPSIFTESETVVSADPVPLENLVYWTYRAKMPIADERAKKFIADFPNLAAKMSSSLSDANISYTQMPLGSIYQLWEYLETQPPEAKENIYRYLDHHHSYGIFSFLVGEHGKENIPTLIQFMENTYIPRTREKDEFSLTFRTDNTFTENLFIRFSDIYQEAWNYACLIEKDPQRRMLVSDLILQRAKAMLMATAKNHLKNGSLSPDEQDYILQSFKAYQLFLIAMADESGEMARQFHVPYSLLRKMFAYYDLEDPDNRALYHSMFELWYKSSKERQETVEYRGKVKGITLDFYREYAELEADCEKTTAPPAELEDARYLGDLAEEFASGYLPTAVSEGEKKVIGFWGAGKLREESKIMAYILGKVNGDSHDSKGYQFVAVDLNRPKELPPYPHLAYHEMDMTQIGDEMPNMFDEIYLIWSPLMDVLELDELKMVFASIAKSLKPGGRVKIDVHFPFGKNSYQPLVKEHDIAHPEDPTGLFAREFERGEGKTPIGKRFAAWDPFTLIPLGGLFGMKCKNFPTQAAQIEALCALAEEDDSFIQAGPQEDMQKQALYRTEGKPPWNRACYIFEMGQQKPDPERVLRELQGANMESILTLVS